MAMNKKERETFDAAVEQSKLLASFHRTAPVWPDLMPPSPGSGAPLVKGFAFVGVFGTTPRVEPACSTSISHSVGRDDKTDTQRPIKLYSTRMLALCALRNAVERECMKRLREVDRMIEDEVQG